MPIDNSIYFQRKGPDIMGGVQDGMKLSQLSRQRRLADEEDEFNETIKSAHALDPATGKIVVDQAKLSELSKKDPMRTQAYIQNQAKAEAEQRRAEREELISRGQIGGQMLSQARDQNSYSTIRDKLLKLRVYDPQELPEIYDRKINDQLVQNSFGIKEQLEMQNARANIAHKQAETKNLLAKSDSGAVFGKTEGLKALDKDFAKDYNDWTSGGEKTAQSEIQKLKDVADSLKNKEVTTGGLTGIFPDRMTSNEVLKARADVQSTVMNSLKVILGSQFTEKEGDRIIKNTWNEGDSTENNLARVQRLVTDLESQASDKTAKAQYFQKRGTLAGYGELAQTQQYANLSDQELMQLYNQRVRGNNANAR